MAGIRDRLAEFLTFDTEVLAISCDPTYSLRAFADADGLNFPLLSDFWPHGEVAAAYGVFDDERGVARRSSFVVDKEGIVRWAVHNAAARRPRPGRAPGPPAPTGLDQPDDFQSKWPFKCWSCRTSVGTVLLVEPLVTRDASGSTHFRPAFRPGVADCSVALGSPRDRRPGSSWSWASRARARRPWHRARRLPRLGVRWRATTCIRPPTCRDGRRCPADRRGSLALAGGDRAAGSTYGAPAPARSSRARPCAAPTATCLRRGRPEVVFCHLAVDADHLRERLAHRRGHYMPASLLASQLSSLEPLDEDEPGVDRVGRGWAG